MLNHLRNIRDFYNDQYDDYPEVFEILEDNGFTSKIAELKFTDFPETLELGSLWP